MAAKTRRRHSPLGIEALEARELMAGDVAVTFGRGTVLVEGPQKSVDLEITNYHGQWRISGSNGTTVNGSEYVTMAVWASNLSINLAGVSGSGDYTWGSNLRIVGINVPGNLTVSMSQTGDDVEIVRTTVGNNLSINTLQGDDEIHLGLKEYYFVGNFNTIGRDLSISSGSGYDTVKFRGNNQVKDDVLIDAGSVGPIGSAEFLTISGLTVGGFGVDNNVNHLTIQTASHVDLDLQNTTVETDLVIAATDSGCTLEMKDLDVGRDLKIQTGDNPDTIRVEETAVGRDLLIYSDNLVTSASGADTIYVIYVTAGRDAIIKTAPDQITNGPTCDWVSIWQSTFLEALFVEMGDGGWNHLYLNWVHADRAYFNGGSGAQDHIGLHDCVFHDWMDFDNFEDVDFD